MQAVIASRKMGRRSRVNSPQINSQNVIITIITIVLGITYPIWSLSLLKNIQLEALQILTAISNGIFLANNLLFIILVYDCLSETIWDVYIFLFEIYFPLAVATLIILIIRSEEPTFFIFNSALLCLCGIVTLIVLIIKAVYKEFIFRQVFIIFYMGYYYILVGWFVELVKACHRCRKPHVDTTQPDARVNMSSEAQVDQSYSNRERSVIRIRAREKLKRQKLNDGVYCDVCSDTARNNEIVSFPGCTHRFHKRCVGDNCPFCRRPAPLNIQ